MVYSSKFSLLLISLNFKVAVVANPRDCTLCRQCLSDPELSDKIKLNRIKDHFIFTIESTGALPPDVLFEEAINILKRKCQNLMNRLPSDSDFFFDSELKF